MSEPPRDLEQAILLEALDECELWALKGSSYVRKVLPTTDDDLIRKEVAQLINGGLLELVEARAVLGSPTQYRPVPRNEVERVLTTHEFWEVPPPLAVAASTLEILVCLTDRGRRHGDALFRGKPPP